MTDQDPSAYSARLHKSSGSSSAAQGPGSQVYTETTRLHPCLSAGHVALVSKPPYVWGPLFLCVADIFLKRQLHHAAMHKLDPEGPIKIGSNTHGIHRIPATVPLTYIA